MKGQLGQEYIYFSYACSDGDIGLRNWDYSSEVVGCPAIFPLPTWLTTGAAATIGRAVLHPVALLWGLGRGQPGTHSGPAVVRPLP